jgi:predicted DNA-binding protein
MNNALTKQQNSYPLRMPGELRARLEALAKANGRSMNAEIVAILQRAVEAPQYQPDMDEFVDQIAEKVAKKLKGK